MSHPVSPPEPIMPVSDQELEMASIAEQIGNAVENFTVGPVNTQETVAAGAREADFTPTAIQPPPSLFQDEDETMKLYTIDDEEEDTSPRPKFDFDDLKFGANFDNEE